MKCNTNVGKVCNLRIRPIAVWVETVWLNLTLYACALCTLCACSYVLGRVTGMISTFLKSDVITGTTLPFLWSVAMARVPSREEVTGSCA